MVMKLPGSVHSEHLCIHKRKDVFLWEIQIFPLIFYDCFVIKYCKDYEKQTGTDM